MLKEVYVGGVKSCRLSRSKGYSQNGPLATEKDGEGVFFQGEDDDLGLARNANNGGGCKGVWEDVVMNSEDCEGQLQHLHRCLVGRFGSLQVPVPDKAKFPSREEAIRVLKEKSWKFEDEPVFLEFWEPAGCCIKSEEPQEVWVRFMGLPTFLWTRDVFRALGDRCGGFLGNGRSYGDQATSPVGSSLGYGEKKLHSARQKGRNSPSSSAHAAAQMDRGEGGERNEDQRGEQGSWCWSMQGDSSSSQKGVFSGNCGGKAVWRFMEMDEEVENSKEDQGEEELIIKASSGYFRELWWRVIRGRGTKRKFTFVSGGFSCHQCLMNSWEEGSLNSLLHKERFGVNVGSDLTSSNQGTDYAEGISQWVDEAAMEGQMVVCEGS
ncbi:hypothetical protein F0562_005762 [Nyssa sinensis]|uniref:Uncharacterized protein n=1 Tax=Nyssa sinensis TaxID=561372 RepID=A0A5J5AJ75_9ASTE|nr:hypothetical protein F0562_005762 [Nyssa sinensis]